jgi:acetyl esterase
MGWNCRGGRRRLGRLWRFRFTAPKSVPLDPRVKRFLEALAAAKPRSTLEVTVAERRAALAELMQLSGPPHPVERVEERTLPGPAGALAVRLYTPSGARAASLPGLIYFHGGGLVAGTLATHDPIARALANSGGCRVISVDYRLAPEHPFPAALDDALAALEAVGANPAQYGIDPSRLGVCGDSAGATLAAAAAQAVARSGSPRLALQVLICPILDYRRSSESRRAFGSGYLVDQATLDHDLLNYAPAGTDPADPRISPLRAGSLAGAPRTLIHTAEFDLVRDDGREYFERLRDAGTAVSYTCHPGMIHLFYGLGSVIPYASIAYEQIGSEIRAAFA